MPASRPWRSRSSFCTPTLKFPSFILHPSRRWLVEHIEAAGFKLAAKSEVNANPKDTKDYSAGVWALPPSLQLGDQDRAKYLAIGESDRMTLKFVKAPEKDGDATRAKK